MRMLKSQSGFTLIEIILSVVILSVGLIAVDQILLSSLTTLRYVKTRAEADRVLTHKIWEVENQVKHTHRFPATPDTGVLLGTDKTFTYYLQSNSESAFLKQMRLSVNWPDAGRMQGISRTFYVLASPVKKK